MESFNSAPEVPVSAQESDETRWEGLSDDEKAVLRFKNGVDEFVSTKESYKQSVLSKESTDEQISANNRVAELGQTQATELHKQLRSASPEAHKQMIVMLEERGINADNLPFLAGSFSRILTGDGPFQS